MPGGLAYTDAHSTSGTSGRPMVDRRGRAVGLHAVGISVAGSAVTPYSGFVPMHQLAKLLPTLERGQGTPAEAGFATEALQINTAAALNLRADAVWVSSVLNSSAAATAGLRAGDVITGLTTPGASHPVRATPAAVDSALKTLHTGGQLVLQIHRPGTIGTPSSHTLQIGY